MYNSGLVIVLGLGVVFCGLLGVVLVCYVMSAVIRTLMGGDKKEVAAQQNSQAVQPQPARTGPTEASDNHKKIAAIILTVLSDELGVSPADIEIKRITQI